MFYFFPSILCKSRTTRDHWNAHPFCVDQTWYKCMLLRFGRDFRNKTCAVFGLPIQWPLFIPENAGPGSFELQFVGSVFADISTSRNGLKKQTQPVGKVCGKKYPSCKRLHVFVHVYFLMSMENTAKLLGVCRCSKLPIEENLLDDWWGSWFVHLTIDSQSDMQAYVGISKYLEMLRFEHIHVYYLYTYIVFGSCKIHLSQCSLVCSYMYTYVYGLSSHLFMNVLIHFCHPLEWLPKGVQGIAVVLGFLPLLLVTREELRM